MLLPATTSWVDSTDGVRLPVSRLGESAKDENRPTVLIGHATGFHGRVYDPMVEALDAFSAVTADLRGHGDAATPEGLDYRWQSFAEDLLAVAHSIEPGRASAGRDRNPLFGFGHSMGAACLLMVEQSEPGTFDGLFCYEPVIHPPMARPEPGVKSSGPPRIERWIERTRKRRARFESIEAARANYTSKPPYDRFEAAALDAYLEHGFAVDQGKLRIKCRPDVEAQIYLMGPRHQTWDRLSEVRCPVMVARGSEVTPGPSMWADSIAAELANAELYVFEGLGHLGPLENPLRVGRKAAEFYLSTVLAANRLDC